MRTLMFLVYLAVTSVWPVKPKLTAQQKRLHDPKRRAGLTFVPQDER